MSHLGALEKFVASSIERKNLSSSKVTQVEQLEEHTIRKVVS